MINVATIMEQFRTWLAEDPALDGFTVSRADVVNQDAGLATKGWIGLYRRNVNYDPRNLGVPPNNYRGSLTFSMIIQKSNLKSGSDAEDDLEVATKAVIDRLVQVPRTYVDHFSDIVVDYTYIESQRTTMYFLAALVTMTAQFNIEVN